MKKQEQSLKQRDQTFAYVAEKGKKEEQKVERASTPRPTDEAQESAFIIKVKRPKPPPN